MASVSALEKERLKRVGTSHPSCQIQTWFLLSASPPCSGSTRETSSCPNCCTGTDVTRRAERPEAISRNPLLAATPSPLCTRFVVRQKQHLISKQFVLAQHLRVPPRFEPKEDPLLFIKAARSGERRPLVTYSFWGSSTCNCTHTQLGAFSGQRTAKQNTATSFLLCF